MSHRQDDIDAGQAEAAVIEQFREQSRAEIQRRDWSRRSWWTSGPSSRVRYYRPRIEVLPALHKKYIAGAHRAPLQLRTPSWRGGLWPPRIFCAKPRYSKNRTRYI